MNYRRETELPTEIEKLLDPIAEEKIEYQPTIQVMQGLRAYFGAEYLKMTAIPKVIPAEMLEGSKLRQFPSLIPSFFSPFTRLKGFPALAGKIFS